MSERETSKQYLKLPEFCRFTGLSPSTVRRRVRDGSIPCFQPGGPDHVLLFEIDALKHAPSTPRTSPSDADSPKGEGDRLHGPDAGQPAAAQNHTNQRGPGSKWKRELDTLQICTPKSKTE